MKLTATILRLAGCYLLCLASLLPEVGSQRYQPVLTRNDILVLGGYTDSSRDDTKIYGEVYKPLGGERAGAGRFEPFSEARKGLAVAIFDETFYACGGGDDRVAQTCVRWNPGLYSWIEIAPMSEPRANFGMASLGGYLYAVGTTDLSRKVMVERYSPAKNSWETVKPIPQGSSSYAVYSHGVVSAAGYLWVVGVGSVGSNETWRYDPNADEWTQMASMASVSRKNFATIQVPPAAGGGGPGYIYVVSGSGMDSDDTASSWEYYDIAKNEWKQGHKDVKLNTPRDDFGGAYVDRAIYVLGGRDTSSFYGNRLASVERLQLDASGLPSADSRWQQVKPLKDPRDGHAVIALI